MPPRRRLVWLGWVLTIPVAFLFGMSAVMKFKGGPELSEGMAHLGLDEKYVVPIAITEIICAVLYLFPFTSTIGAILLTGYLGGAILSHVRVGDPIFVHIGLGIMVWLALCLREPRLWQVMPWRRSSL